MSTNYYVHTADEPEGSEGIHLGKYAAGGFTFRAYPERNVADYETWLSLLDLGEIRAEHGVVVSRDEMVEIVAARSRPSLYPREPWDNSFVDAHGCRFIPSEFC